MYMASIQGRLLMLRFAYDASPRRIAKLLDSFCNWVNRVHPECPVEVMGTMHEPAGQAILSVWYPTNRDEDAPIAVDKVKDLLSAWAGAQRSYSLRYPDVMFVGCDRVQLLQGAVTYTNTLRARDMYLRQHGLLNRPSDDGVSEANDAACDAPD